MCHGLEEPGNSRDSMTQNQYKHFRAYAQRRVNDIQKLADVVFLWHLYFPISESNVEFMRSVLSIVAETPPVVFGVFECGARTQTELT